MSRDRVTIEQLVEGYVLSLPSMMDQFAQYFVDAETWNAFVPLNGNFGDLLMYEMIVACTAHSMALTPDPVVHAERDRWVQSHRQSLEACFDKMSCPYDENELRQYLEVHDEYARSSTNPFLKLQSNMRLKFPVQKPLEVFAVVLYDKLNIPHEVGDFEEYPEVKNAVLIEYLVSVITNIAMAYWIPAFKNSRVT